jgi:hypothetical protein
MIGSHWLLIWSFLFFDGHAATSQETYYNKEYCVQRARIIWKDYYRNEYDKVSIFKVLCKNENNNYDFVKVICDANGNCNV